ncbi:hypothetical protein BD408DRAFT_408302 [Parasitella parasitica]|nr:hypothetical protein BD408DRAFT_408302 [Parasitella parasitica]
MSGKKKAQKMSLSDFLAKDAGSDASWADDMIDLPSAPASKVDSADQRDRSYGNNDRGSGNGNYSERDQSFGGDRGGNRYGRGGFGHQERNFASRAPVDLPEQPPYTAHVANLSFDATDDDLTDLFSGLKVSNIRLITDRVNGRSKGFGYVEFEDVDSLKGALELSGESVKGRNIRINVAEPTREREQARRTDRTEVDSWRRSSSDAPSRGFGESNQSSFGRGFGNRNSSFGGGNHQSERPRLNLKPRTVDSVTGSEPTSARNNKPDPFGGAKPVDTGNKHLV